MAFRPTDPVNPATNPATNAVANSTAQFVSRNPQFLGSKSTPSNRLLPAETSFQPAGRSTEVSMAQGSQYRRMDKVAQSAKRLTQIHVAGANARKQRATEMSQYSPGNAMYTGQSSGNPGAAWQANGKLSNSRNSLLRDASSYLGSRYVLGGRSYRGIDCSGLVMNVYNKMGFGISRHSAGWQGRNIPGVRTSIKNLRPGDIVAWRDGSHIAIYAGNGEIIEAANPRVGTVRRRIWANPNAIYGIAVRLPGE